MHTHYSKNPFEMPLAGGNMGHPTQKDGRQSKLVMKIGNQSPVRDKNDGH